MKWVKLNSLHVNTDTIIQFRWLSGMLYIWFVDGLKLTSYDDPERELYTKLCLAIGVKPVEVGSDGQN